MAWTDENPLLQSILAAMNGAPGGGGIQETDYSSGFPAEIKPKKQPADGVPGGLQGMLSDMTWENFDNRSANLPGMEAGLKRLGASRAFENGAPPIPGLLDPSALPGQGGPAPAQQAPAMPPMDAPVNVPPPPQVASVPAQMPPMGMLNGGGATDMSAASRAPAAAPPAMPEAAAPQERGFFQKLDDATVKNPGLFLGLAAGFAGAPSFGTGMSRGFAGAAAGTQQDQVLAASRQKTGLQASSIRDTYKALIAANVPRELALAAAQNPAILQQIAPSYLADRKSEIKELKSKDAFGNETSRLVSVNPYDNTTKDITPGNGDGSRVSQNAVLAPGVTAIDSSLAGDDYLKQFSPEVQAGVKAYMRGDSLPTGRQQSAQVIKQVAQKYGDDIGVPANDQDYAARKAFRTSLGNTNSGVGMQTKGFQQGLHHMAELTDKLVKLGNWNGLGLEDAAGAANWVRNRSTSQRDIANGVGVSAQALAGEIGKLFSGSSGGGVREREETTKKLGDPNMSGPAAAGAIESTLELMMGGLQPLQQRRDELFGPDSAKVVKGADFLGTEQQHAIEKIRKNIQMLRGGQSAPAPATPPAGKTSTNVPWKVVTP